MKDKRTIPYTIMANLTKKIAEKNKRITELEAALTAEKQFSKDVLRRQINWFDKHYPEIKDSE